jgi:hypothetical protein
MQPAELQPIIFEGFLANGSAAGGQLITTTAAEKECLAVVRRGVHGVQVAIEIDRSRSAPVAPLTWLACHCAGHHHRHGRRVSSAAHRGERPSISPCFQPSASCSCRHSTTFWAEPNKCIKLTSSALSISPLASPLHPSPFLSLPSAGRPKGRAVPSRTHSTHAGALIPPGLDVSEREPLA